MTALFLGTAAIGRGRPTRRFSMAQSRLRWRFARVQCLDPIIRCPRWTPSIWRLPPHAGERPAGAPGGGAPQGPTVHLRAASLRPRGWGMYEWSKARLTSVRLQGKAGCDARDRAAW
jgi:hypothetical protein